MRHFMVLNYAVTHNLMQMCRMNNALQFQPTPCTHIFPGFSGIGQSSFTYCGCELLLRILKKPSFGTELWLGNIGMHWQKQANNKSLPANDTHQLLLYHTSHPSTLSLVCLSLCLSKVSVSGIER